LRVKKKEKRKRKKKKEKKKILKLALDPRASDGFVELPIVTESTPTEEPFEKEAAPSTSRVPNPVTETSESLS
jgi:hypothetical protein